MARKQSPVPNTGSPQNTDDFRLIKGIGAARGTRLHKVGILTFRQLASFTPAELAIRLGGLSAKQIAMQDWPGQARKLASKKPSKPAKNAPPKKAIRQHYENFTLEFLVDEKHAVRRTRVSHIQSGDADTWAGWEAKDLIGFLARHTGIRVPVEIPEKQAHAADLSRKNEPQTAELEIEASTSSYAAGHGIPVRETTLPALQFPVAAPPAGTLCLRKLEVFTPDSEHPVTFLRQDQSYLVRLTLDLTEVNRTGDLPLICKASVVSRQLGGARHSIGEILSILTFSNSVDLDINGTALPPGTYRLEAFAEVRYDETTPGPTASLKGDLLQVY